MTATLLLLSLLFPLNGHARWATPDDAEYQVEFENAEVEVQADGKHSSVIEKQVLIAKDDARSRFGTIRLYYNSRAASLEVIEAHTQLPDGTRKPVPREMIQDKPLAATRQGFDQQNQVLIAFPEVITGARVYVKYKQTEREVPFEGFYSESFIFGWGEYEKASRVKVTSALKLHVAANDPARLLKVKESRSGEKYVVTIEQKKPAYLRPIDESEAYLLGARYPWVDVSTASDWGDMAKPVLAAYEEISSSELPPAYARIVEKAKAKARGTEQLNFVTSRLAEEIHYWADWRPIRGGHIPRKLGEIASSRFGDCKDFAVSLTAMIRRLGYESSVAWVKRDSRPVLSPNPLPIQGAFNHAITWVRDGAKVHWLDGTNRASFAQGVPEDIIDRPSLVLHPKGATLERIPPADPSDSGYAIGLNVQANAEELTRIQGRLGMKGRSALSMTGEQLNRTKETIDYSLVRMVSSEARLKDWKVDDYDLRTRVASDQEFRFRITEEGGDVKTTAGPAYSLSGGGLLRHFMLNLENRVSDLFVGQPITVTREVLLEKAERVGDRPLDCEITSPWFEASRKVSDSPEGIRLQDRYRIKQPVVRNEDLLSKDFRILREKLRACFDSVAVIHRPLGRAPAP